ncbi:uncharacterized protein BO97DRAFT_423517 [Aspergillus homomorphus CBS 101889]|uniref:Uncharacterized protein n=1 Tax=Aspergillus homomorphus (strain CBS 101889) TaxID=1450537 RepID=A0A395I0R0_ASPHC|nr:hypothetical protein BO97DRAFT_423517 [Aspergillus homomorphus CBS 101889]RAL13305.1 hypothetical protein BO97DRAFT_423517 [Aspergillus homomorphus CBS 101889]
MPFSGIYPANGKVYRRKHFASGRHKDPQQSRDVSDAEAAHSPHHTTVDWTGHDPAFRPQKGSDYEAQAVCKLSAANVAVSPALCWRDALWEGYAPRVQNWGPATVRIGLGTTERLCSVLLDTGSPYNIIFRDHALTIPGAIIRECDPFYIEDWGKEDGTLSHSHKVSSYAVFFVYVPEHLSRQCSNRRWERIVVRAWCVSGWSDNPVLLGIPFMYQESITLDVRNGTGVLGSGGFEFRLDLTSD